MRHTVLRHPIGSRVDPATAFAALFGDHTDVVWLDSGVDAASGKSYLGSASRTVTSRDVTSRDVDGSIFEFLRAELTREEVEPGEGFQLGWVGWLGYELRFQTLGQERTRQSRHPDAAFLHLDRALEFDHGTATVTLLALGDEWEGELARWRDEVVGALASAAAPPVPPPPTRAEVEWAYPEERYLEMIESCQEAIREGDAYQLCLTTEAHVAVSPDPFETYLRLRASSPSHHGALLRVGGVALLSSSPEQFLSVSPGGVVESKPIKGTRRRGTDVADDDRLRAELESSDKERAENLMIVDLMRNDIGRVSRVGSVEVSSLLEVESYAQLHQLVSTVRGQLADGLDGLDAVAACFPAGSMTGAPKHRATLILDDLEARPRGIYSGAFGYFGLDGRIDLAMVIRSILIDEHGSRVGAGGGITALSVPTEELEEVRIKAAPLLAALGAVEQDERAMTSGTDESTRFVQAVWWGVNDKFPEADVSITLPSRGAYFTGADFIPPNMNGVSISLIVSESDGHFDWTLFAGESLVIEESFAVSEWRENVLLVVQHILEFAAHGIVLVRLIPFLGRLSPSVVGTAVGDDYVDKARARRGSQVVNEGEPWIR